MSKHAHRRNWWPLFWHLIHASISNCLYIYRLEGFTDREISHLQLQERLGLQLLRNPASVLRQFEMTSLASTKRHTELQRPDDEHQWTRMPRRECVVCTPRSYRRRGRGKKGPLAELGINIRQAPARKQGKRSTWGCYQCEVSLCKDSFCWQRHHGADI
jgi:hypothetical protein